MGKVTKHDLLLVSKMKEEMFGGKYIAPEFSDFIFKVVECKNEMNKSNISEILEYIKNYNTDTYKAAENFLNDTNHCLIESVKPIFESREKEQKVSASQHKQHESIEELTEDIVKYLSKNENKQSFFIQLIHRITCIIVCIISNIKNELDNAKMRKDPKFHQEMEDINENANLSMEIAEIFMETGDLFEAIKIVTLGELFYGDKIPEKHMKVLKEIVGKCIKDIIDGKELNDIVSSIIIEEDGKYEDTFKYLNENRNTVCRMDNIIKDKDDIDKIIEKTALSLKLSGINIEQINNRDKDRIGNRNT